MSISKKVRILSPQTEDLDKLEHKISEHTVTLFSFVFESGGDSLFIM